MEAMGGGFTWDLYSHVVVLEVFHRILGLHSSMSVDVR